MTAPSTQFLVPFRKSTHIALSPVIRQYVTDKYGQHPDAVREDMAVIDTLRRDAVNVREAHTSGVRKLQAYAGQLAWMGSKFPVAIGADFTWYPSLGYSGDRPVVHNNLKFERANVLFNLAALYGQLAAAGAGAGSGSGTGLGGGADAGSGSTDADGLKASAAYFMQAAGVFKYLRDSVVTDPDVADTLPGDMDDGTLECLERLMLAQAQECFWLRAVSEQYKDATIAKLAARLSDLYGEARDAATRSLAVSNVWIHSLGAKHHHFAAAAQYRASLDCLDKKRYGEEIARLQDALACTGEGLAECKGTAVGKGVADDLAGLRRRIEQDLKRAERDNDIIYLQVVPAKAELRLLERANMAVARVPAQVATPFASMGEQGEFGPALFAKLVPFAVHLAVSVYEERRDRLVNQTIVHELEVLTEGLHATLLDLQLPGCLQAIERPLGLPGSLVQHAEEVRYADAVNRAKRSFADIDKLRAADRATFDEGRALLAVESDEDAQLRRKHGPEQWGRPAGRLDGGAGQKLWASADEIEGYFASSAASDAKVRDMFAEIEGLLGLLAGPDRALMDFVPNSRRVELPEAVRSALGRLRSAYNDAERLESRRRRRVEAVRDKARADDVRADILRETARLERAYPGTAIVAAHFDTFFATRLQTRYDAEQAQTEADAAEQARLLEELGRAHRAFAAQRRAAGLEHGGRAREAALQQLDGAHQKYKEMVRNVEVGRTFYNDLGKIVGAFRDKCRAWVQARRSEAQAREDALAMPVLPLSLAGLSLGRADASSGRDASGQAHLPEAHLPEAHLPNIQAPQPHAPPHAPHQPHQPHQPFPTPDQKTPPPIQQPQPQQLPPALQQQFQQRQMWTPEMGLRFGAPSSAQEPAQEHAPAASTNQSNQTSTWNPAAGIRFG